MIGIGMMKIKILERIIMEEIEKNKKKNKRKNRK